MLNRRSLLQVVLAGAGVSVLPSVEAKTAAAEKLAAPAFVKPTAAQPLLLCYNENPLGMSAAARAAAAKSLPRGNRYAFMRCEQLRKDIATYIGGKTDNIVMTHGSSEAIRASIEAFAFKKPDTQLLVPELTYSDGADVAARNEIPVKRIPMGPDWSIDVAAMRKAAADYSGHTIVYFVNPNNPTSTIVQSKELLDWIRSKPARTMFVIDEAYGEFVSDPSFVSAATLVKEGFDNLVVLKTFSKIFAMAGMRLGFSFSVPAIAKQVRAHVAYDVMIATPTIEAAISEINDKAFIAFSREQNAEARKILEDALKKLGIKYLPSQTNFVFMDLKAPLKPFSDRMAAEHILVGRPFPPATTWCRISLGTPAETAYFVKKLFAFREKGWV